MWEFTTLVVSPVRPSIELCWIKSVMDKSSGLNLVGPLLPLRVYICFNLCLICVLENNFDRVIVDVMSPTQREYSIPSGRGVWKNQLIERFPEERIAIETFFSMVNKVSRQTKGWIMVKVLPIWLVNLISLFGLPRFLSDFYSLGSRTLNDVIQVIILSSCIAFKLKPYHILFILAFLIILELN